MNDIRITKATIEDLEDIQYLNQLLFIKEQKDYDEKLNIDWPFAKEGKEYFNKFITVENKIIFIAKEGNKSIGYIACSGSSDKTLVDNPMVVEIQNILVMEEYRSLGVGKKLIYEFKNWAQSIEAKRAYVVANEANKKGIEFYKQNGFEDDLLKFRIEF